MKRKATCKNRSRRSRRNRNGKTRRKTRGGGGFLTKLGCSGDQC